MQAAIPSSIQCQTSAFREELLTGFDEYLARTRGLLPSTRACYARHIRGFLDVMHLSAPGDLGRLDPAAVFDYIAKHASKLRPTETKQTSTALRGFLRYLAICGECDGSLAGAVPTTAKWSLSSLPKVLTEEHVKALLESFDLSTPIGLRNHAIVVVIARLGLRASEVARLTLDDIAWRSGIIRIANGKGRRPDTLPLPAEVGRVIATYLQDGRPKTAERHLFVRHDSCWKGSPMTNRTVRGIIYRAWEGLGVKVPSKGTHAFRHTLATRLLANNATIKQVADILRHRCLDTTYIYTKVDLAQLSELARAWLEVE